MPTNILETLGTVLPDGTLELDQKVTVAPGRVKVRLETVETFPRPKETLVEFVDRTRRELTAAGHKFMNDEEVTAWVEELRADDDRIEDIYRRVDDHAQPIEKKS